MPKYKSPEKRPLYDYEKDALKNANLDPRKRAFISILYYCGLRKSEALALTPSDFDWNKKYISVSKAWTSGTIKPYPKSDNGVRKVPLPESSIELIQPFVETENSYIFHGRNKKIMTDTAYRRMWESIISNMNAVSETKITDLTAHILRHNYCTELCYQVPLISTKKIAQLLGDTEQMVLEVYSHTFLINYILIIYKNENSSFASHKHLPLCLL